MRTTQRDQGGAITFGAAVADAASGSGVAQPGSVPFTFTRVSANNYQYNFDLRLRVLSVVAVVPTGGNVAIAAPSSEGQGGFTVSTIKTADGTAVGNAHRWTCTALDRRT